MSISISLKKGVYICFYKFIIIITIILRQVSCYVFQAVLELLGSSSPASACHVAGILGVCHYAQLVCFAQ